MAGKRSIAGEIAAEYLKANKNIPLRECARNLVSKHPEVFSDVELTRAMLRRFAGSMKGSKTLPVIEKKERFSGFTKSLSVKREDYVLPSSIRRLGIISDVHVPFHDETALEVAVNALKQAKIDALLINGDFADFFSASFHEKDPRKRPKLMQEIDDVVANLRELRRIFKGIPIYYKTGNHEDRLRRYLAVKAEELLHDPEYEIPNKFKFGELGIQHIDSLQRIRAGKLLIFHGHEMRGSGGVNPARWLALKTKVSSMCGHFHRKSSHEWRDANGNTHASYSLPCLCELTPDYMPENEWSHGFAICELSPNGDFSVQLKTIIDGRVY